jgi:hypothetical protein
VADLVEEAEPQKSVESFSRSLGPATSNSTAAGPGDIFVNSKGYKAVRASDMRPSDNWSSGPVDVGPVLEMKGYQVKGTLLEGATPGGDPLVQPDVRPGVVETLFQAAHDRRRARPAADHLDDGPLPERVDRDQRGGADGRGRRQPPRARSRSTRWTNRSGRSQRTSESATSCWRTLRRSEPG